MDIDRLLNFSLEAGKNMLQSGAETYRVEETVSIICKSFDVDNIEVFASPTTVLASIYKDGKIYSAVKRITSSKVDLNKVHNINSLSREISLTKPNLDICEKKLDEILIPNEYSLSKTLFFAGVSTSTFTVLFDGSIKEFICAFFIGILIKILSIKLNNLRLNEFFIDTICGALVSISSIFCLEIGLIDNIDKLVAGSIMLLVPGLIFTNAIRDLLEGELVSGVARMAQVFFVGLSIALGTGSILHFYLKLGGI